MALSSAKLIQKIELTHDVYELHYDIGEVKKMIPGQFITFILPQIGGRAYSVLEIKDTIVKLIIKRWSQEMGGRGGSMFLCDAHIGDSFQYVGPTGHFILSEGDMPRCFLGTGTGFVPLYNQIIGSLERSDTSDILLVFGVRSMQDLFYLEELQKLSESYNNFTYEIYLSKEKSDFTHFGYVTEALEKGIVDDFQEFYLCGAPGMIESSLEKLISLGANEENIYFEKY